MYTFYEIFEKSVMVDELNIKLTETKNNTLLNKLKTLMKTHGETIMLL